MTDSVAQNVAFGKVKFAVEIRKDKNSHIFVTGQARDNYDFSYLPDAPKEYGKDFIKDKAIKKVNNTAYWLQCTGKIRPYIWGAELSWDFMPGEQ